jgi:putative addiction module component (TIGR02574 family)
MPRKSRPKRVQPNTKTVKMSPEWVAEINRRIDDIESGRVNLIPEEEVHASIERILGRRISHK